MSNYAPTRTSYDTVDRRWLPDMLKAETHGINLDADLFIADAAYDAGDIVPSGTQVATTGGPYGGPVNEVQTITVDATGGTFTITFDGETTAAISATATAADVQAALEAISNINPGDVTVTGGPGDAGGTTPYVLTFGGQYAGEDVPEVTTDASSLTGGAGTAAVATTTEGASAAAAVDGYLVNDQELEAGAVYHVAVVHAGTVRTAHLPDTHDTDGEADLPAVVHL